MVVRLMLLSENETILRLVGDFAKGLGCPVTSLRGSLGRGVGTELPDAGETLLELLNYIALSATKAGIDPAEPLCRITYWHPGAAAEVTMGLRVTEFSLDKAAV